MAGRSGVRLTGVREAKQALRDMGARRAKLVDDGLYEVALEIMADSKAHYVPVDTGTLRDSGVVERRGTPEGDVIVLRYTASYALRVHENPRAGQRRGHGQWRFLATPYEKAVSRLLARLVRAIRRGQGASP